MSRRNGEGGEGESMIVRVIVTELSFSQYEYIRLRGVVMI